MERHFQAMLDWASLKREFRVQRPMMIARVSRPCPARPSGVPESSTERSALPSISSGWHSLFRYSETQWGLGHLVARPGLDPGTLGLKETLRRLLCVGLVAHVVRFQGIVLFCVGLVLWCCGNMRPKMRPART